MGLPAMRLSEEDLQHGPSYRSGAPEGPVDPIQIDITLFAQFLRFAHGPAVPRGVDFEGDPVLCQANIQDICLEDLLRALSSNSLELNPGQYCEIPAKLTALRQFCVKHRVSSITPDHSSTGYRCVAISPTPGRSDRYDAKSYSLELGENGQVSVPGLDWRQVVYLFVSPVDFSLAQQLLAERGEFSDDVNRVLDELFCADELGVAYKTEFTSQSLGALVEVLCERGFRLSQTAFEANRATCASPRTWLTAFLLTYVNRITPLNTNIPFSPRTWVILSQSDDPAPKLTLELASGQALSIFGASAAPEPSDQQEGPFAYWYRA